MSTLRPSPPKSSRSVPGPVPPAVRRAHAGFHSSLTVRLRPVRASASVSAAELSAGRSTIGSQADCDLVLSEKGVAARHCTLIVGEHQVVLKAWSPLTWINEGVVSEAVLKNGDRLILGPVELKVEIASTPQGPHTAMPRQPARPTEIDPAPLLAASRSRQTSSSQNSESRHLTELKSEIERSLAEVLHRERTVRDGLSRERLQLRHRSDELSRQWKELEAARTQQIPEQVPQHPGPDLEQQRLEQEQFQTLLADRHTELAGRASRLAISQRELKLRSQELAARTASLEELEATLNGRESRIRALISRNDAQLRQLTARQREIERQEIGIHQDREELTEKTRQLETRIAAQQKEHSTWTMRWRSQERLLEELEQQLRVRRDEISQEAARLETLRAENYQLTASAEQTLQGAEERSVQLNQLAAKLECDRQELQQENNRLITLKLQIAEREKELASEQSRLEERSRQLEFRQLDLAEKEAHLQTWQTQLGTREKDLEAASSTAAPLQALAEIPLPEEADAASASDSAVAMELQARQAALEHAWQEFESQKSDFAAAQERLQAEQAALSVSRGELESAQSQLDAAHADLQKQQADLTAAQESLRSEQDRLEDEQATLRSEYEQLEHRQADFEAESRNLVRLRTELADERSRDAYEREQLQTQQNALRQAREKLAAEQTELQQLRAELEQRQQQLDFAEAQVTAAPDRGEAESSQLKLDTEWLRLQVEREALEKDQARFVLQQDELTTRQQQLDGQAANLHENQTRIQELEAELAATEDQLQQEREQIHDQSRQLEQQREDLIHARNRLEEKLAELQQVPAAPAPVSQPETHLASPTELSESLPPSAVKNSPADGGPASLPDENVSRFQGTSPSAVPEGSAEDEAALKLRSRLANLFGMAAQDSAGDEPKTSSLTSETPAPRWTAETEDEQPEQDTLNAREDRETDSQVNSDLTLEERLARIQELAAQNSTAHSEPVVLMQAVSAEETPADNEEVSVEDYMKRLLARNRREPAPEESAAAPAVRPLPAQPAATMPKSQPVPESPASETPVRRTRKLDAQEKRSIREDLHSFREVANRSARSAVAKSKASKQTATLRLMLGLSGLGWISAAGLLAAPLIIGQSLLFEAVMVGGTSALLSGFAAARLFELKKLQTQAPDRAMTAHHGQVDPSSGFDTPEQAEDSPLSFL